MAPFVIVVDETCLVGPPGVGNVGSRSGEARHASVYTVRII
jgi:hypothetical protein